MIKLSTVCQENSEEKLENSQKSYKFVQISQNFLNISETSKYLKKYAGICV